MCKKFEPTGKSYKSWERKKSYWRNRICDSWTFQYYFPVIKDGIKIDSSSEYMKNHAKNVKNNNLFDLI